MDAGIWTESLQNLRSMNTPANDRELEEMRDRIWLEQIAAGKEEALSELYALYGQRLYAFALRLTGDPAQAEDVVQEVLLVVWRDAARFRGQGRVIAWLLGIVHHTAFRWLRKNKRTDPIDEAETMRDELPLPEEHVQANEQRSRLADGLQQLSREHREVLDLVFYQKLSLEETAGVLHCPLGTVKSRLSYARRALRGELERSGAGKEEMK